VWNAACKLVGVVLAHGAESRRHGNSSSTYSSLGCGASGESCLIHRDCAVADYWIWICYCGISTHLWKSSVSRPPYGLYGYGRAEQLRVCALVGIGVTHPDAGLDYGWGMFLDSAKLSNHDSCDAFLSYETAISLFCSCAKVRPSGACRNKTISDCLKYRRASDFVSYNHRARGR
jgi:hypothetical protein